MANARYEALPGSHGRRIRINARGNDVLNCPRINRGSAFTQEEREHLGLVGLLPTGVIPLEGQLHRVYEQFRQRGGSPLAQFAFLASLRHRNTVLFYRLLAEHIDEMLPIVYTPTVGEAIEQFSHWYKRLHGVFLSIDHPQHLERSLLAGGLDPADVDIIVVTDSEGILGIGDQGVGGVQIAVGKQALYTAAGGVDPDRILPVVLDVGTDNMGLLNDGLYIGLRHSRVRGQAYDDFVDHFVQAATKLFPRAMIHWEDFGASNATRILERYGDQICTFNDDIQGTASVVLAAVLSAVRTKGEQLRDQTVVIHGAGTAGIGIAELMRQAMEAEGLADAHTRFYCLGSRGLIRAGLADRTRPFQRPYARSEEELEGWDVADRSRIALSDVVRNVHPSVLIGTSAQPGCFKEALVREMASHVERPVILPLSNPTAQAEATPSDLLAWTDGRALIATGSPFDPVTRGGTTFHIAQANNALVFPGLGLGVVISRATRVTDRMIMAASQTVARLAPLRRTGDPLLPSIRSLRRVSAEVALAVARVAAEEGIAQVEISDPVQQILDAMWQPVYPEIVLDGEPLP